MTGLTVLTLLVVMSAAVGRVGYPRALAIGGATPAGAALTVGSLSVPTFYAVAIGAAAVLAWTQLNHERGDSSYHSPPQPGILLLWIFFGWSVIVTLTAPLMFDGLLIVHPRASQLAAGTLTASNFAQIIYLFLGICVVLLLSRSRHTRAQLLGLTLSTTLLLSFARHLSLTLGLPFPEDFFDNSPGFVYIETAAGDVDRVRGVLSEPAALATTCVATIAYLVPRSSQVRGMRRVGCGVLAAVAVYLGFVSTSTTFIVAGALCAMAYLAVAAVTFAMRRTNMSTVVGLVLAAAIVAVAATASAVLQFVRATLDDKIGSESFADRTSTNTRSFEIFLDTFGWGVGLGSARASSLLITLLTAVGVIGALLAVFAVASIVAAGRKDPSTRPAVYVLVAYLIVQTTSGADLSDPTGVLWISLGILGHASWRETRLSASARPSPSSEGGQPLRPVAAPRDGKAEGC